MLKKTIVVGIASISTLISVYSCNSIVGSPNSSNSSDSTENVLAAGKSEVQKDTVKLMDLLDSLNRGKIKFPEVDSLNKIDPKQAKRTMRDSIYRELNKKDKHIYLTFDDGPLIGSSAIDSIITSKNVKISAFLVGKHAGMSKRLKRDFEKYMNNPLVDCYNHSFTHAANKFHVFYSNPDLAVADFEKCETDLGLKHKIVRMPGRNIWLFDDVRRVDLTSGSQTADLLGVNGYKIYGWDMEWKINGLSGKPVQSVDEIYGRVRNMLGNKSTLKPNNIVLLMHDDMFQNKKGQQLLSNLIDSLKQHKDYKFDFIANYPVKY
ncbi:polysaccharide deacetylase family protein [Sphingobacterium cellulitidis]|uniref:polysaccharide deacetylase family protein n=1 Tax=Sphingobacterium cellulitidis TaxID=1768011 RepID=UPI00370DCC15